MTTYRIVRITHNGLRKGIGMKRYKTQRAAQLTVNAYLFLGYRDADFEILATRKANCT